jgi:hypothetical protein
MLTDYSVLSRLGGRALKRTFILPFSAITLRGAVKIVVEHVLRVRMVYVAIYLNIDYASG